jgi:hypothetical protein
MLCFFKWSNSSEDVSEDVVGKQNFFNMILFLISRTESGLVWSGAVNLALVV